MASTTPEPLIWHHPEPPGRKNALTRRDIVRAAITVADAEGSHALTMRAVADEVGASTPMSLYRYVLSKDGLLDLMLDAVSGEVEIPDAPSGDWRADTRRVALGLWQMARRHPWFAELLHSRPPFGPHTIRRAEFLLTTLAGAGLSPAMNYVAMLEAYVTGTALTTASEVAMLQKFGVTTAEDLLAYTEQASSDVSAWIAEIPETTLDERFELGLDCLLDGFAVRRAT
jgi:AcrR family transcriptional regulator